MTVRIGSVSLERVLSWEEEESMTIPKKKVLGRNQPLTQSQYFVRTPRRIIIVAKTNASTKIQLRALKNEADWQELYDYDDTFVDHVWIENINPSWRRDLDSDYPWEFNIELICSTT